MRVFSLGKSAQSPCLVVQFKQMNIMLDCALDMSSVLQFVPLSPVNNSDISKVKSWSSRDLQEVEGFSAQNNLKEINNKVFIECEPEVCPPEASLIDFASIDVILLSNYYYMLALPFITEYSGFSGQIYATEPTIQIGSQLMEELVMYSQACHKPSHGNMWKSKEVLGCLPPPLCNIAGADSWKTMYSLHDVKSCVSKINGVTFSEKVDLYGALKLTSMSSGFCLGSCNWLMESSYEKITYLSSSSQFTTHPQPMEQSPLRNSDVLIVNGLTQAPTANPDGMLGEFCTTLASTIKSGGNVLVPCYPSGVLYDLFECLQSFMDNAGLGNVPIYFISPVADSSLAYSNIFAEWLCQSKQSKVYLPEAPFPHAELVKSGRLKHYPSLHGEFSSVFKTPCVLFTGHPSLRYGDAVHFVELWGKSSNNTIIFTEPDFPYLDALAPFQPLSMKASYCPIDPRLNYSQINKSLKDLKPRHVIVPESYTRPPMLLPHRGDLIVQEGDFQLWTHNHCEVLNIPLKRSFERITLSNQIADHLNPQEVQPGVSIATVSGELILKDNLFTLQPRPTMKSALLDDNGKPLKRSEKEPSKLAPVNPGHLSGSFVIEDLLQALSERGLHDTHVQSTPTGHIIYVVDAVIKLERGETHIVTHGNEALRTSIRDSLVECLSQF